MAAVDHAVAMGVADAARLGVGGWSYGGILTDVVITKTDRFKAAISGARAATALTTGLSTDRAETFDATAALAKMANLTFAQFVMMTPFPGTVDFQRWEKEQGEAMGQAQGIPLNRYWLIPGHLRPKLYTPHPTMSPDEIRMRTQRVWDDFYSLKAIWARADCVKSLKSRLAFVLISKLYRQMYANTGIATDSARHARANRMARWIARPCRRLFVSPARASALTN